MSWELESEITLVCNVGNRAKAWERIGSPNRNKVPNAAAKSQPPSSEQHYRMGGEETPNVTDGNDHREISSSIGEFGKTATDIKTAIEESAY